MTGRKHVNLFVRNTPNGAMCSSVIHEWAKDKYDSVSVCYCDHDSVDEKIHELYKLIRLAESEGANPCKHREVIVIGMWPYKQSLNKLASLDNIHVTVDGAELMCQPDRTRKIMKEYLGFFKRKWLHGYRQLYEELKDYNYTEWRNILDDFVELRGADELEHLVTAYVHDLKPTQMFDAFDMVDYYYSVFLRRNPDDPNQTEGV